MMGGIWSGGREAQQRAVHGKSKGGRLNRGERREPRRRTQRWDEAFDLAVQREGRRGGRGVVAFQWVTRLMMQRCGPAPVIISENENCNNL